MGSPKHNPKTVIVVGVVWGVVVTIGRTHVVIVVSKRPAAQHQTNEPDWNLEYQQLDGC